MGPYLDLDCIYKLECVIASNLCLCYNMYGIVVILIITWNFYIGCYDW
nr:MAG TPA: hypothetical protein [Caudoviricetes sp.]